MRSPPSSLQFSKVVVYFGDPEFSSHSNDWLVGRVGELAVSIKGVLKLALEMKARPADYWDALKRRTLLMFFEKPSLRTRVSLEAGTTRRGNKNSPRHRRISTQA